jgi:hypothetical protein
MNDRYYYDPDTPVPVEILEHRNHNRAWTLLILMVAFGISMAVLGPTWWLSAGIWFLNSVVKPAAGLLDQFFGPPA